MRRTTLFISSFAFSLLLLAVVAVGTGINHYTESFTSKLYCDTLNTTALWDTVAGELKLRPFELTLAGSYGTPDNAYGVALSGDYAYVADQASGLRVIDVSDPANPTSAGSCDTPGYANAVAISGDYVYVADNISGLQVIDISNPTSPSLAGNYDTPGYARDVAISGDYAYVADGSPGLQVIDISDPTNPSSAGSYNTSANALGVAISGDYAYVADGSSGLQVIDISDPTNPSLVGSCDTPGSAYGVAISGDCACVADAMSGLFLIDISDPTSPSSAGSYNTSGNALDVAISGDYAYVADGTSGLQVINISDPTSPSLAGSYDTPGSAYGVAISGDYAYVADYTSGLQVIDIADPIGPSIVGSYDTPQGTERIAIAGDYAYIANAWNGLWVIDISDPTNPLPAGSYSTHDEVHSVAISGDYTFMAVGRDGLQVIDISDPTNPSLAGSCDTPGFAFGVAISGDYAYVADYEYGLQVMDISDPTSPSIAGSCDTPGLAQYVSISGDYAYVADSYDGGLQVIDISDPTDPSLAGSYDTPGYAHSVAVSGDYAYVADGYYLLVLDISDPTSPSLAGSCSASGNAFAEVAFSGDYAYVACREYGLQVIDISDPTNPSLAGSCDTPGSAYGVAVAGDYAYVTDYSYGLQAIWILQRLVITADNRAQSTEINSLDYDIGLTRLVSAQTDSIRWEVSANGGTDWQEVLPDASWNIVTVPGNDFRWRSTHVYSHPFVNPTCSNLVIDWMSTFAIVDSITDISNDQGRQVSISWTRSGYDYAGSPTLITEYAIYRRIDHDLTCSRQSASGDDNEMLGGREGDENVQSLAYPPGDWDYITTVPANCEDTYAAVVPTLADSTITEGMYYTTYFVRARTASPAVCFDSYPDSGYSVDNLAPTVPQGFSVAYNSGGGTDLAWDVCEDEDFQYFRIYRSESEDFEPSSETLVHMTAETNWLDTIEEGWRYHYRITAVDFSGNESDAASAGTVTGDDTPALPQAFALYQNAPNPFNPATTIRFDLPVRSPVKLAVYNVKGELIRVLLDREIEAGPREIRWNGRDSIGRAVASGIYFYRLDAPAFRESRKMILIR
jgi:hypothetical protein